MTDPSRRSFTEDMIDAARASADAAFGDAGRQAREEGMQRAVEMAKQVGDLFLPPQGARPAGVSEDAAADSATDTPDYRRMRAETERLFDAWSDSMRTVFSAYLDTLDGLAQRRSSPTSAEQITLGPIVAGERTTGTMWVRNPTDDPLVNVVVSAAELISTAGDLIRGDQLTIEPAVIDLVEPHTSVAVSVRLDTRPDSPPGLYKGFAASDQIDGDQVLISAEIVPPTA